MLMYTDSLIIKFICSTAITLTSPQAMTQVFSVSRDQWQKNMRAGFIKNVAGTTATAMHS